MLEPPLSVAISAVTVTVPVAVTPDLLHDCAEDSDVNVLAVLVVSVPDVAVKRIQNDDPMPAMAVLYHWVSPTEDPASTGVAVQSMLPSDPNAIVAAVKSPAVESAHILPFCGSITIPAPVASSICAGAPIRTARCRR